MIRSNAPSGGIRVYTLLLAISAGVCVQVLVLLTQSGGNPVDALCYWLTDPANPYNRTEYQFVYPPVAAQIVAPLLSLPFAAFTAILRAIEILSLVVLTGPLAGALIFATPVASEVNAANINLLIGVVIVLGFRWPALWVIALLTKPSMGIGLLWFVIRGEWRKAAVPIVIARAFAAVSFAVTPHLWFEWLSLLADGTAQTGDWPYPYSIWVRLPIALAVVVWGAKTNRRWTVALAAGLALPRLYYQSPAILVAMIPLLPGLGNLVVPWTRRLARLTEVKVRSNPARGVPALAPERPAAPAGFR